MNNIIDERSVIKKIMNEIGLDLNYEGYILDQDTNEVIFVDGKLLKYSFETPVPVNKNIEMYFDPINNLHLMSILFSYYLKKLEIYEDVYFSVYFSVKNELFQHAIVAKNEGHTIQTNFYNNITLAYAEMISIVTGGTPLDMFELDKKNFTCNRR